MLQIGRLAPRPLLVVHGGADQGVPLRDARALYERAGEPKELRVHPEADHDFTWHRDWLQETLVRWLRERR